MKIISIIKRKNLKYMPGYKWDKIGFNDNIEWFHARHETKWEAWESAKKIQTKFPDLIIKI